MALVDGDGEGEGETDTVAVVDLVDVEVRERLGVAEAVFEPDADAEAVLELDAEKEALLEPDAVTLAVLELDAVTLADFVTLGVLVVDAEALGLLVLDVDAVPDFEAEGDLEGVTVAVVTAARRSALASTRGADSMHTMMVTSTSRAEPTTMAALARLGRAWLRHGVVA